MHRSRVAATAAAHASSVAQLAPSAAALQPSADGTVKLPLHLDVLPSVLQFLLSTRSGIEQHVAAPRR